MKIIVLLLTIAVSTGCTLLPKENTLESAAKPVESLTLENCKKLEQTDGSQWKVLNGDKKNIKAMSQMLNQRYASDSPRRLAIFIDGTGNISGTRTNVWKLYTLASQRACLDAIIPYYHQGLGTNRGIITKNVGLTFGTGIDKHIRDIYLFLAQTYQKGDEIFIFGFSRGAYTARALNGMVEFVGLLDPASLETENKTNEQLKEITKVLHAFYAKKNDGKPDWAGRLRARIKQKIAQHKIESDFKQYSFNEVKITAIGVFDTVPALGIERDDFPDEYRTDLYAQKGFHALSIDEQRDDFRPLRFSGRTIKAAQTLKEVWFAGAHADVGGGYKDDFGLESLSRQWMIEQFAEFNIFPNEAAQIKCNNAQATCERAHMHDEFLDSKLFGKFGLHWRVPHKGDVIHGSVLCRYEINALPKYHVQREPNKRYRPENMYLPLKENYKIAPYSCL